MKNLLGDLYRKFLHFETLFILIMSINISKNNAKNYNYYVILSCVILGDKKKYDLIKDNRKENKMYLH